MTTEFPEPEKITVEVVYALPERYWSLRLQLPCGSTVSAALLAARACWATGIAEDAHALPADLTGEDRGRLAIFGQRAHPDARMRDGDRLEILRPLLADPKQRRRDRADGPSSKKR